MTWRLRTTRGTAYVIHQILRGREAKYARSELRRRPAFLLRSFSTKPEGNYGVLSFLAKLSDKEFHEREIARRTGISFGSANRVLNELFADGILLRRQAGKMLFYSFNSTDPLAKTFRIFVSVSLLRSLIKNLKECASEIVLFGSCARGEDVSDSDMDLFVISEDKDKAFAAIDAYKFKKGFEHIRIEPVVLSPQELLKSEKTDKEFLSLVRE